jgi:hypothetical protein
MRQFEDILDWDVLQAPIYDREGNKIEGHKVITRSDTGKVLQVCKETYTPTLNAQLLQTVRTIAECNNLEIDGFASFNGGVKVMAYLRNPAPPAPAGHKLAEHLVIGNSHDGTTAFFMGLTTKVYRCENMFTQRNMQAKVYHRSDQAQRVREAAETIDLYYDQQRQLYTVWEDWNRTPIQGKHRDSLVNTLLKIEEGEDLSTRKRNSRDQLHEAILRESEDLGNNVFAAFNGVTYYTTHVMKRNNVYGNPFGQAANLNEEAFLFCRDLAEETGKRTVLQLPPAEEPIRGFKF